MNHFSKKNLLTVFFLSLVYVSYSHAGELITEEEALASREAVLMVDVALASEDANSPAIEIVSPDNLSIPIKNPFLMEITFIPKTGNSVDLNTFRAFYGALKIDITERLMKQAIRTATGLKLHNVNVPSGTHNITLTVKDKNMHTVEKQIKFRVE
jgi:hypothetical protein